MKLDPEMDALLDMVKNGTPFESLRAAKQINQLTRKWRLERERSEAKEKETLAATK
jgi:hypothetical protein